MCGICGIYSLTGKERPDRKALEAMTSTLAHRGPDDEGFFIDERAGLGMRRLAVIDLVTGEQPIETADGRYVIVYNGEVYNFRELRREMESRGRVFRTNTDTEVVLELFAQLGPASLERLNGMFALAIYDRREGSLFLARDRMGIKPLYYGVFGDLLIFASEPKGALAHPAMTAAIDREALAEVLANDYVSAPRSIFEGLSKLGGGHTLTARDGDIMVGRYWTLGPSREPVGSLVDATERLEALLADSVERRLVADVPVGVFLSGGVDSSTIAATAARLHGGGVKTYSIGFEDKSFDEARWSALAARHIGTDHHHRTFSARDLVAAVDDLAGILDEPFGDASIVPTWMLSRFAREEVTVALAGDGGDELFAGYPTYQAHALAPMYERIPRVVRSHVVGPIVNALPVSKGNISFDFQAKRFHAGADRAPVERHMRWMGSFAPEELSGLFVDDYVRPRTLTRLYDAAHRAAGDTSTPLEAIQRVDLRTYLQEDILVKTDRASMAASLEVRVPMLDHRIVEFALALPMRWKLRGLTTKWILKKRAARFLPGGIVHRKKKGFGIPVARWLDSDLRQWAWDLLGADRIRRQGIFRPEAVNRLLEDHHSNRRDNRKPLWTLLTFQTWYDRFMER